MRCSGPRRSRCPRELLSRGSGGLLRALRGETGQGPDRDAVRAGIFGRIRQRADRRKAAPWTRERPSVLGARDARGGSALPRPEHPGARSPGLCPPGLLSALRTTRRSTRSSRQPRLPIGGCSRTAGPPTNRGGPASLRTSGARALASSHTGRPGRVRIVTRFRRRIRGIFGPSRPGGPAQAVGGAQASRIPAPHSTMTARKAAIQRTAGTRVARARATASEGSPSG